MAPKLRSHYGGQPAGAATRRLRLAWQSAGAALAEPPALPALSPGRDADVEAAEPFVAAEELFLALEGQEVTQRSRTWTIEVFSVVDEDDRRWVQLNLKGSRDFMVTLNLAVGDGLRHALLAISSWLANPAKSSRVLNVA